MFFPTIYTPNPVPSTRARPRVGVHPRTHAPQGGMSPTALSAMFPSAATSEGQTAAEAGSQRFIWL